MKTLANIFNNVFFRVPDYQRGYAWEEAQLEDFWKDLNWLRDGHQHYTGMLTLHPIKPTPNVYPLNLPHDHFHLVDGQQRITTAYLLLSKLIRRAEHGMISGLPVTILEHLYISPTIGGIQIPVFGYDSQTKMDFLVLLSTERSALTVKPKKIQTKNIYEMRLLQASDYFDKKLREITPQQREVLFNRLTTQLVFDTHMVGNTFDVCAMFESINYRGKRLTKFEVLKNRLMYLSELLAKSDSNTSEQAQNLRKGIENAWGTAFDWFGRGSKLLDEDDFLLNHSIMYFGSLPKDKDALDKRLFKTQFSTDRLAATHENPLTFTELHTYVESIRYSSGLWAVQNARTSKLDGTKSWLNEDVTDWLLRLNRLGMRHFQPLILGALNRMGAEGSPENANTLTLLLSEIERFIFIVYGLCDYDNREASKTYFKDYGFKIFEGDVEYIFKKIRFDIDQYLENYDEEGVYVGRFSRDRFVEKVHARFIGEDGWSDWDEVKYFLSEWEIHFKNSADKIINDDAYTKLSLEHILPQNVDAPGQWQECQTLLGKRFKYVLHDIGNLTLLRLGANKAVHDICLKEKSGVYDVSCDGKDILRRAEKSFEWNESTILSRGTDMVKFMFARWNIPAQEEDSDLRIEYEDVLSKNVKPPRQPRKAA